LRVCGLHYDLCYQKKRVMPCLFIYISVLYIADKENVQATDNFPFNYPSYFAYISRRNYVCNHDQIRL